MVNAPLVGLDIALGERLIESLDASKFPFSVALWMLHGEGEWTLLIGTPRLHGARSRERCIAVIVSVQVSGMGADVLHIQPGAIP